MHPSLIILLLVRSKTNRFLLFSRLLASSLAPSSMIMQSLKWRFVSVSFSWIPLAKALAPSTPMMLPSKRSLVKNFLFWRHLDKIGMQLSLMHMFWRVITLKVSLSISPSAIAVKPASLSGLLFKLILLSLYLFDRISPICLAPTGVIWLFSR